MLATPLLLFMAAAVMPQAVVNGGFEGAEPTTGWTVTPSPQQSGVTWSADTQVLKEGRQSLLLTAEHAGSLDLRQEVYLPVGTLWRLYAWVKVEMPKDSRPPGIFADTPSGSQGSAHAAPETADWQRLEILFRAPSPGRIYIHLTPFDKASGRVWLDDVRLEPVGENAETREAVRITAKKLGQRPIDLKQGGQFIEPLCDLLPSMIAQQVRSTSFEEDPPWKVHFKQDIDRPFRPWYPDGAVHVATYSLDTDNPFNGKVSQKIVLPIGRVWAGISQDGFYLEEGHSYKLRLHLRSQGDVKVRASLHGDGDVLAGPVSLGAGSEEWRAAAVSLRANDSASNATLTIEFSGPGTLWLDRIYLIDENAVLGLWRPDVVNALKAMNPGIIRFGGSEIEYFEWDKVLGDWDHRAPALNTAWGGINENFVGVEEFVQLCRYIGAEPLVCVRWTGRKPEDAAAEVEYFNGDASTKWGALRARNGHAEPYAVKYWQVGNEIDEKSYEASLLSFATAMKTADPAIRLLSSFPTSRMLKSDGGYLDYLSPHDYSVGDLASNEKEFQNLGTMIRRDAPARDVRVAVTEWNTTGGAWDLHRGMLLTLGNALACSRYQNLLHRNSDLVEIANRSNLSDSFGSGMLQPGPGWLVLTPVYYTQSFYQRAAGSFPLEVTRTNPLTGYLQEPDLSATLSPDGKTLRLYSVNSTPAERHVHFELDTALGEARSLKRFLVTDTAEIADPEAMNTRDSPGRVTLFTGTAPATGNSFPADFPPFSITLLEVELTKR
jgi:alpha-N-arabinofuranosidase